ncbi:MAG: amino acid ABC transporter permease [Lachnospiraceae bacterium]|nr:amino acid ABC transporter permease [Lachnospiraceae bacterium]
MFEALDSLWAGLVEDFYTCFIEKNRWKYLVTGLENTLLITFFALLIGVVIGIVISIVRSTYAKNYQEMKPGFGKKVMAVANWFCGVYLTVIRGTPVVVQLMIIYYCVFVSSSNGILIGAVSFGINSGAYVAEIFRSGIMSIDNGQFEAGRSLGFNYVQTLRYIVLPQAFKNVLPSLANEFIVLLKETSVAGYVAVRDLTKGGDIIRGATYQTFMPLLAVALIYLILVMFFTRLVNILERRLRTGER